MKNKSYYKYLTEEALMSCLISNAEMEIALGENPNKIIKELKEIIKLQNELSKNI